ncbi:MFS transporter, partial [Pantoea sp. CTOTU49201]|uniref:MFS transporter n=1 Tax=Pantoea sp. CTOTU49201 TaxID=2953855 RepID=UPI00289AA087
DRIGRRPLLIVCTILMILTTWPVLHWLVGAPTFARLVEAELWLSFLYASYNGAMVVYLAEIMPAEVRASGFSLAYSLATALFGGFTPAVSSYLIHATGDKAMPGVWLSFAAVCGLVGTLLIGRMVKQYQSRHSAAPVSA